MKKMITTLALAFIAIFSATAQNFSGSYSGTFEGADVSCQIEQNGKQISGTIRDTEGADFEFSGTISGSTSAGTMVANGAYSFSYTATHSASASTFKIYVTGDQSITVKVSKQSASKPAVSSVSQSAGKIDPSVVGTWMQQSSLSSSGYGGYGDYASMVSVTYYIVKADGTLCVKDGGSVGSGADWSYTSGSSNNASCGKWYVKDGYIYITQNGQTSSVKYTMHNGQLVLGTKGNYVFLSRAN